MTLGGREPVPEAAALGGRARAGGGESEPRHQGQESGSGKELAACTAPHPWRHLLGWPLASARGVDSRPEVSGHPVGSVFSQRPLLVVDEVHFTQSRKQTEDPGGISHFW